MDSEPTHDGDEQDGHSALSDGGGVLFHPPALAEVLQREGSARALAIFAQERSNALALAGGQVQHQEDALVPCLEVGSGEAAAIDVHFAFACHAFECLGSEGGAQIHSVAESAKSNESAPSPARAQVTAARELLDRFLLRPLAEAVVSPASSSSAATRRRRKRVPFPPLHIEVSAEELQQLRAQVEHAEQSLASIATASASLLLPASLFSTLQERAMVYIAQEVFPAFVASLSCEHLEAESLLLGSAQEKERLLRSAHACNKEEYALFYLAYESIRAEVQAGPPTTLEAAKAGTAAAAVSSNGKSAAPPSTLESLERAWLSVLLGALEHLNRVFIRPQAEFAIWVEPDVRVQIVTLLQQCRVQQRVEPALLQTLQALKDYATEVVTYDVLPQFRADAKVGHRRNRRASLIENDAPDGVTAADAQLHEQTSAAELPAAKRQSLIVASAGRRGSIGSVGEVAPPAVVTARRPSLMNAAVDVPLHARRGSLNSARSSASSVAAPAGATTSGNQGDVQVAAPITDTTRPPALNTDDGTAALSAGPSPSSNPHLRTMSQLRVRRTSTIATAPLSPRSWQAQPSSPSSSVPPPPPLAHSPSPRSTSSALSTFSAAAVPAALAPAARADGTSSGVVVIPASALGAHEPPPPPPDDEDEEDEEDDAEGEDEDHHTTVSRPLQVNGHAPQSHQQFPGGLLSQMGKALSPPVSPSSAALARTAAAVSQAAPTITGLRRRSIIGAVAPSGSASASAHASAALSSAAVPATSTIGTRPASTSALTPVRIERSVRFPCPPFLAPREFVTAATTAAALPSALQLRRASAMLKCGGHSYDAAKKPARSILKTKVRSETLQEALRRVFAERMHEVSSCLPLLQAGRCFHKLNAAGDPADRWVNLSADGGDLCWKPLRQSLGLFSRKKHLPLADVTFMRFGSWAEGVAGVGVAAPGSRFAKYNAQAAGCNKPWRAFSICFPDKQLDLILRMPKGKEAAGADDAALDAAEAEADDVTLRWFSGVQALAPLAPTYLSRAGLLWRRASLKLLYYASWQQVAPEALLDELLEQARSDVNEAGRGEPEQPALARRIDAQIRAAAKQA